MTVKATTFARLGIVTAGVTIAFAAMAQAPVHPKSHAPAAMTKSTAKSATKSATAAAPATPTPKPGQVVPTSPTPASTGAVSMPAGPESEAVVTASADPAKMAKGKELFTNFSCGSCHALSDAGADGHVGPALDGNKGLTEALVKDRVTNGQGPMPAFAGQMTDEEIADVSVYVANAAKK